MDDTPSTTTSQSILPGLPLVTAVGSSAINALPTELLEEIFLICSFGDRTGGYAHVHTNRPPLLFLVICRRWRIIALATPALWATMQLAYPRRFLRGPGVGGSTDEEPIPAVVGIRVWLASARELPISLFVREDTAEDNSTHVQREQTVVGISKVIGEFSSKWTILNLDVSSTALRAICFDDSGVKRPFSSLRHLSIAPSRSAWASLDIEGATSLPFFDRDIRLQSLFLSTTALPVNLLQVSMSFEYLTELGLTYQLGSDISTLTPLLVFRILSRCVNLRVCRLTLGETAEPFGFEPQTRLRLPGLRSLAIVDGCPITTESLMAALHLPSLERLRYNHSIGGRFDLPPNGADEPILPIQSLQLRPLNNDRDQPSPLVRLALHLTADDEDDELEITDAVFEYLSSREGEGIRCLELNEPSFDTASLLMLPHATATEEAWDGSMLSPSSSNTEQNVLCPNLETILWTSSGEDTRLAFIDTIRQRSDADAIVHCSQCQCIQLREVNASFWEDTQEGMDKVEEALQSICGSGVGELIIRYKIFCWLGPASEGKLMSKEGFLKRSS